MTGPNGNADLGSIFMPQVLQPPRIRLAKFPLPGEEADNAVSSINISTKERGKYSEVMAKIDEYFKVGKNFIFKIQWEESVTGGSYQGILHCPVSPG